VHNTQALQCGRTLEKFPKIVLEARNILERFMDALSCIDQPRRESVEARVTYQYIPNLFAIVRDFPFLRIVLTYQILVSRQLFPFIGADCLAFRRCPIWQSNSPPINRGTASSRTAFALQSRWNPVLSRSSHRAYPGVLGSVRPAPGRRGCASISIAAVNKRDRWELYCFEGNVVGDREGPQKSGILTRFASFQERESCLHLSETNQSS